MNLLINPSTMVNDGYSPPPLGLLYLAAMDPETIICDAARGMNPHAVILEQRPKLVGVTMYTAGRKESLDLLRAAKDAGARTVAGGPHVSVMSRQLAEHYPYIDHLVLGDGELAWQALCEGRELPRIIKMPVAELDRLPLPRWDAVDLLQYPGRGEGVVRGIDLARVPRISVVLSRGCTGSCTFCSTWWVNGKYRVHSKDWMRRHLDDLWQRGVRHLVFQDDCLSSDRHAVFDLCDVLDHYGFAWFGTTRADMLDYEMALRMKACGCYELTFGLESGSEEILRRMHKKTDLNAGFSARMICRRAGIKFTALMMFGFPWETPQTRQETQHYLQRLQPDGLGTIGHVAIMPGTALYAACRAKGLIDDSFWLGDEPYYIYRGGLA